MNRILLLLFAAAILVSCKQNQANKHHPANETEANIYKAADSMMAAFKRRDWMTYAKYNHPSMQKMFGGQQGLASFVNEQMKQVPDTTIKNIEAGKILQVVKTDKDEQCVIEQTTDMHIKGLHVLKTNYLVGESLDGGKTWTFLDVTSGIPPKTLKPDISPQLKIPEKKQTVEEL